MRLIVRMEITFDVLHSCVCATFHPVSRPPSKGQRRGSSLEREMKKKQLCLLCFPSLPAQTLSPPLEMILHRTRLDGAISPMKSILFLGPFSSLSFEGGRTGEQWRRRRRSQTKLGREAGEQGGNSSGLNFQQSEREG